MAEATRPGAGGVTCYASMPELKERKVIVCGHSTFATTQTLPAFYEENHDAYIVGVDFFYTQTGTANAATFDLGTAADDDAIVDGMTISNSATAGTVTEATLASTLKATTGSALGFPKIPKQTAVIAKFTTGGANNGRGAVQITYVLLDKGIG